jgi:hypothetical protein
MTEPTVPLLIYTDVFNALEKELEVLELLTREFFSSFPSSNVGYLLSASLRLGTPLSEQLYLDGTAYRS